MSGNLLNSPRISSNKLERLQEVRHRPGCEKTYLKKETESLLIFAVINDQ